MEKKSNAMHARELEAESNQPSYNSKSERLVNIQSRSVPVEPVAFYAYLSTHEAASSAIHHIIAFDKVITNVGNAYHPHTGTFIAPRSGLYIFTWTIAQWGTSYHVTERVVDNDNVNVIYMNPANLVVGSVTGTVVVHVNQGDDVFVRTGSGQLLQPTTIPVGSVAFYAYFSLIFLHRVLSIFFPLISVVNSIYLNPVNTIDGGVIGTVVVEVNQGDDVLVRTGITSAGEIISAASGRSSFAGWLLM
uniref:C1q domain-containing protein n=1 Tax=Magallana gigas TaxID=29159 RepID=A0A8W8JDP1_MAGGI